MESGGTYPVPIQWSGFGTNNLLHYRNEVINELSRAPVKVRHWLLMNENFQAGLEVLNPNSISWIHDERVRVIIKIGLIHMVSSTVEFARSFPDAQIPKV
jgi:hypothetical protein